MPTTHEELYLELIPKEVDTDPLQFLSPSHTKKYCDDHVTSFIKELPRQYRKSKLTKHSMGIGSCVFQSDGNNGLLIGYKPDYHLFFPKARPKCGVDVPVFQLSFAHRNTDLTVRVLQLAFEQFFLRQKGDTQESLIAYQLKGDEIVKNGLDVLREYLQEGTGIEARCNPRYSNTRAPYTL
ncbi:hypothetical protein J4434_01685 [Candidatus Woesearchaeota archaeon]|nr:hypothetical protein [Candidatus Woesearchaeota archaeon]